MSQKMQYGCIGRKLTHSFSGEIHARIAALCGKYTYTLKELEPDQLDTFMRAKEFDGINVTIPYKRDVIPYLDEISREAREIGAVNTIVNRRGKLYGYNTDVFGIRSLAGRIGMDIEGAKVLITGSGGTSLTARYFAAHDGAGSVIRVGRRPDGDVISYSEAYEKHTDADYIINTTPCGMFGGEAEFESAIDLSKFGKLRGVLDVVYNPLRTPFLQQAKELGIPCEDGLYMLVDQAVAAAEMFTDKLFDDSITQKVFDQMLESRENIVLIGMPGCGKSTVGKILSDMLCRKFVDLDDEIVEYAGMSIPEIFAQYGEKRFRELETLVLRERVCGMSGCVIATGGGAPTFDENLSLLRRNGRLYFLDRPLDKLLPTDDRPLASSAVKIKALFAERYEKYTACADEIIKVAGDADQTAKIIAEKIYK